MGSNELKVAALLLCFFVFGWLVDKHCQKVSQRFIDSAIAAFFALLFAVAGFWLLYIHEKSLGVVNIVVGSFLILFSIAIAYGIFFADGTLLRPMYKWSLTLGTTLGGIGFIGGFFGPLIFSPESNQGPLLGIFFTGPIGFALGLLLGPAVALVLQKRHKRKLHRQAVTVKGTRSEK